MSFLHFLFHCQLLAMLWKVLSLFLWKEPRKRVVELELMASPGWELRAHEPVVVTGCWASTCESGHAGKGRNGSESLQAQGVCEDMLWITQGEKGRKTVEPWFRFHEIPICLQLRFACLHCSLSGFLRCNALEDILLPEAGTSNKFRQVQSWTTEALLLETRWRAANSREGWLCLLPVLLLPWWSAKEHPLVSLPWHLHTRGTQPDTFPATDNPSAPGRASLPSWECSPPFQALLIDVRNA